MSNLVACQPGWLAVFGQIDGDGYATEPVACWLLVEAPHVTSEVRPICALGGEVCDATTAENYIGVVGPGGDPKRLVEATRATRHQESATA
jgi:hypothetical protein